jgi:hypothetical protein
MIALTENIFIVVLQYWGLNSEPLHQPFFVMVFFEGTVSRTISLGWL